MNERTNDTATSLSNVPSCGHFGMKTIWVAGLVSSDLEGVAETTPRVKVPNRDILCHCAWGMNCERAQKWARRDAPPARQPHSSTALSVISTLARTRARKRRFFE